MNNHPLSLLVNKHRDEILSAERYIWEHPETGYKEWNTSRYVASVFESAGYTLTYAEDIPGFYTDIDTGRPGPKILILGELDALLAPAHPEAVNGCAHACGHNTQCAAVIGAALALKEPGALDGLCGSIRLMIVPAEEMIEIEFRESLRKKGTIRYLTGKVEFLHRGYMDGVDIAYMIHACTMKDCIFACNNSNGCTTKEVTYEGVASHAGARPHQGVNALYAASLGLHAINSLRETFRDADHVRVHPIMTYGGGSVSTIPSEAKLSMFVRGAALDVIAETNQKVNRALAAGALALGAKAHIYDRHGYAPLINDPGLLKVAQKCMGGLVGLENVKLDRPWGTGSTDMGDLSCLMPVMHADIAGVSGHEHGDDYEVTSPEMCCVLASKALVLIAAELLKDNAASAREVLQEFVPRFSTKKDFFRVIDTHSREQDLLSYEEDGAKVVF